MVIEYIFAGIGSLLILWKIYDIKKRKYGYIDEKGYERDGYNDLVHRRVAYKYLYNWRELGERFGFYDIHHIDGNKRNNSPDNLQILTREEHMEIHGR